MATFQKIFKQENNKIDYKSTLLRRKIGEKIAFGLIWMCAIIAIAALAAIAGYVVVNGLKVINLEFLTTRPAGGVSGKGGISTTIVTTIYLVILTTAIAAPLGIFAAIYMVEYAEETEAGNKFVRALVKKRPYWR